MKKTKKGITLVELIICCAIIVMLGGACTAVLASGATLFNKSSSTANAQMDADVFQTHMLNLLPSAKNIEQIDLTNAKGLVQGTSLFFNDNGKTFTIRTDGKNTTIRSITGFSYSIVRAGTESSENARAQLLYTVTLADGSTLTGGFVLSNIEYDSDAHKDLADIDLVTKPIRFNNTVTGS